MGFGANGIEHFNNTNIIYRLTSSTGEVLKTYSVPPEKNEEFQKELEEARKQLSSSNHEEITVVKIEKITG